MKTETLKLPADRVLAAVLTTDWALEPKWLETIVGIVERQGTLEGLERRDGLPIGTHQSVSLRGEVAVMPVVGPIMRYADMFTKMSGMSSYSTMSKQLDELVNNPDVTSIILHFDSPGGEVNGCSEFADQIKQAAAVKPVYAYVGGTCCSAAYWLASSTREIIASNTAVLGSIGVIASIMDRSKQEEANGVQKLTFVSSQSPNKYVDPKTDAGAVLIQERIDAMAEVFVNAVAENRNVSASVVEKKFGKGGVKIGSYAVEVGLADRLGNLEDLIAELSSDTPNAGSYSNTYQAEDTMNLAEMKKKDPDGYAALMAEAREAANAETSEQVAALNQELATAKKEKEASDAVAQSNQDQLKSLAKDVAKMREANTAALAASIVEKVMAASGLPERIVAKITPGLSYHAFVTNDTLDVVGFEKSVQEEANSWKELIPAATGTPSVMGLGTASAPKTESTVDDADILSRFDGYNGVTNKEKE